MIRLLVLTTVALAITPSSASAAELLAPLIISALAAAAPAAGGIATIAIGVATVGTSRSLLALGDRS